MKKVLFALVVIFSCFSLVGCDGWFNKEKRLAGDAKPGVVKQVEVAKDFTVTLAEDPSTNTKWVIESKPDFLQFVDENKRTYSPTKQDRRFTFRATKAGSGQLTFVRKGWDKDSGPLETLSFPVEVK